HQDIYPTRTTPKPSSQSSESVTDNESRGLNLRGGDKTSMACTGKRNPESFVKLDQVYHSEETAFTLTGDTTEVDDEQQEAQVTPYEKSTTKRDIRRIAICRPPVWSESDSNRSIDEDHTKVGVPSLPYAPSTETYKSSELTSLTCSPGSTDVGFCAENVEVHFGGEGA
ncbi:hypothetical protein OSTOST_08555, partial [Ostertagia ostertagi]